METLLYNIGQVLGITIIHSLWQGLLVYIILRLILTGFPSADPDKRYKLLYGALLVLTFGFACTFFIEAKAYNWTINKFADTITPISSLPAVKGTLLTQPQPSSFYNYKHIIQIYLPYISIFYVIGLAINMARLVMAWQNVRMIRKELAITDFMQAQVLKFSQHLGIDKPVQLSFTKRVNVPCIIGYVKPVLLLPLTISTLLSVEEIEAILLHELAHIKNNDYIINLIQQVIAVLLFLNPFAQLISRMISRERENRCDDVVVQQIDEPLLYAQALVKLEEARQPDLQLALAATGTSYHLFGRVQRIMATERPVVNIKHLVLTLIIFIFTLGSIAWLNPEIKNGRLTSVHAAQAINQLAAIVKKVIAPQPIPVESKLNPVIKDIATAASKEDTANNDTLKNTPREVLIKQYVQYYKAFQAEQLIVNNLPETKQIQTARKILDSVRHIKIKETMTPELIQQSKEQSEAFQKFMNSPEQKKREDNYNKAIRAYFDLLNKQPESIQFEKNLARETDSISTQLMQSGLSAEQIRKSKDVATLLSNAIIKRDSIRLKLLSLPEVKLQYDSLENVRHMTYSGPEWDDINKKTKATPEMMAVLEPTGLEKYHEAVKEAVAKQQSNPEWKKLQDYIKKYDEVVNKLYGRKN